MFRPVTAACVIVALAAAGCQPTAAPSDAEAARDALRQALDGWKKGDSADALKAASRPVTVADYRREQGARLLDYEIAGDGKPDGFDVRFRVNLSLESAGKKSQEKAIYNVSTNPKLVVVRIEPGG